MRTSGHLNTSVYVRDLIRKDLAERGLLEEPSSLNGTLQLSSTYDAVGKRIEFLKKAVVTYLNDLRNKTILNLIFVGTTVVLFVAAVLWSNLIGLIAAAGLQEPVCTLRKVMARHNNGLLERQNENKDSSE